MLDLLTRLFSALFPSCGKVMYIGGSDILPPPLSNAEEQQLLAQAADGSEAAKQRLIERNLRLVVYIARRFENTGINIEDLISIGTIGLIKAVSTFRADRNIKLATYSSRCIENEILMHIRKIAGQKTEVSLDEPINTDWDGNELAPTATPLCAPWRRTWSSSSCARPSHACRSATVTLSACASGWADGRKRPRRRLPT